MGLFLEEIEIQRFRGMGGYSNKEFGQWTSYTGSNSSNKSSIINAISLLGTNRTHKHSDIPLLFKPTEHNRFEIPFDVTYVFRLLNSFDQFISDSRLTEAINSLYELDLIRESDMKEPEKTTSTNKTISYLTNLKYQPLNISFKDGLYNAIRKEVEPYPNYDKYQPLFKPNKQYKMPEILFDEGKYLKIFFRNSIKSGPEIHLYLLDENKSELICDEAFYHWVNHTEAIDDEITLVYAIGAVFLKAVQTSLHYEESPDIPDTFLSRDGSNIRLYIQWCLTHHTDIIDRVSQYFKRLFDQSIKFKKATISEYHDVKEILIEFENGNTCPVQTLSDGMFHALLILFQIASSKEGDILLIDEPELHLHPGAAKALRDILEEKKDKTQIICATHSPIFIDPMVVDKIILHKRVFDKIIIPPMTEETIESALRVLGSSGMDSLLFDFLIWVEGPSDKKYVQMWLKLLATELDFPPVRQIGIFDYGGKDKLDHIDINDIKKINRNAIFIVDSDIDEKKTQIDNKLKIFKEICEKNGLYCWITERKEIENYIPPSLLETYFNLPRDSIKIDKFTDVIKLLKDKEKNFTNDKLKLAKKIAPLLTIEHIKQDKGFYDELTKFITELNKLKNK